MGLQSIHHIGILIGYGMAYLGVKVWARINIMGFISWVPQIHYPLGSLLWVSLSEAICK